MQFQKKTLQNGGSIPLLLEILVMNNSLGNPKFFENLNELELPNKINLLYNVLLNLTIDDNTKIELIKLIIIKYNGDITAIPTNIKINKNKNLNLNTFEIILAIINQLNTTDNTKATILKIF